MKGGRGKERKYREISLRGHEGQRACLYSWWGGGRGQMACSGRGSGMKTEWVRWMGPEPGGRAHAEHPDAVRTSHAAKPRNERPLGPGCGEDGGRRLHTDRGARVCDMAVPRGRGRPSSLAAGCSLRNSQGSCPGMPVSGDHSQHRGPNPATPLHPAHPCKHSASCGTHLCLSPGSSGRV